MLIPAALVADELTAAWKAALLADLDRFRWYRMGAANSWLRDGPDPNGDWAYIMRASVVVENGAPRILGYCSATMDRDVPNVTQLSAWSARPRDLVYMRDLQRFLDEVRPQVRWVRWNCAVGNPAMRIWERWAEENGGGRLCVLRDWATIRGGTLVDVVQFEVPGLLA